MDPYEYLFEKLGVIFRFMPEFNTYNLLQDLESGSIYVTGFIPINWTKEFIFKYYKNMNTTDVLRRTVKSIDRFCRQLSVFPDNLESKEHVDLLLAVNGMNIGA